MSPPRPQAAWWRAALFLRPAFAFHPNWLAPLAFTGVGLTASGCAALLSESNRDEGRPSLEVQKESGWNVDGEGQPLAFPDVQVTDVQGTDTWREALLSLALRLAPAEPRWLSFYDPTLFQSLQAPRSADLRLVMRPILTPGMAIAARRGDALLSLFMENGCRNDVAIVLDIPGPDAVAVAAALAPCFDPVFMFGNWPHPLGVVPSHLTLAAALYYLPSFEKARAGRSPDAAPVFVLDSRRLAPYSDQSDRFDNRYLVGLPPASALGAAGIRQILYVTPDDQALVESDDLNDDLIDIDRGGIDVRLLALSDFAERPLAEWLDPPVLDPLQPPDPPAPPRFYFGGSPASHGQFWSWYGGPRCGAAAVTSTCPAPALLRPRIDFRPVKRPTFWGGSPGRSTAIAPGWRSRPSSWQHGGGSGFGAHHPGRHGSLGRVHVGGGHFG